MQFRHPWSDGTTHLVFDPVGLLERLAVLIPRPRINLILYHGVLPFDVAQGTPSMVEGWGRGPRGPSTLLRTIPSHVEGWRSLVVHVRNTADYREVSATDASTAKEYGAPGAASEAHPPAASVADARVGPGEPRATEPVPDPPCGREGRPSREGAWLWADLMRRSLDRPNNCTQHR